MTNYTREYYEAENITNAMNLIYFFSFFGLYVGIDAFMGKKYEGKYYFIHGLNNAVIVYFTYNDLVLTFSDFNSVLTNRVNILPSIITFSFHVYHTFVYYPKFKFDDWLHHILMGTALFIAHQFHSGRLINYSLFFTTGLPGMIDYFLLFFVKNNKLDPIAEKKINSWINLWIRCPGCTSHAVLMLVVYNVYNKTLLTSDFERFGYIFTAVVTFWNGIYFMNKVVVSYINLKNEIQHTGGGDVARFSKLH
jgi:hypothetical protein